MRYHYSLVSGGVYRCAKTLSLTALAILCSGWLAAQSITGTITDDTGMELIGATVLIEGTTTGTATDFDGSYSIEASEGAVLVYSYTGYLPQRITVGNQTVIDVSLDPNVAVLDQIVVTGYNQQRKGDITGAVAVLNTDELTSVAASSVNQRCSGASPESATSPSVTTGLWMT